MGESQIELAASLGFESSRMQRQYGFKPKKIQSKVVAIR